MISSVFTSVGVRPKATTRTVASSGESSYCLSRAVELFGSDAVDGIFTGSAPALQRYGSQRDGANDQQ